jgi:4,5-DOPA dioxygenase extradiol
MMTKLPAVFLSHGAPNLILGKSRARDFLTGLSTVLPRRPEVIIMVSAHWETAQPVVNAPHVNKTIYDFGGFERELYTLRYPAAGSSATAQHIVSLFKTAGLPIKIDHERGLDHGAWVPLMLAWPAADIPVVQLSVQTHAGVDHHLTLGAALEPLRSEGALIIGSGSFTHDLRSYMPHRYDSDAAEPPWVTQFAEWMNGALERDDI